MAVLQTSDGRLLRRSRPRDLQAVSTGWGSSSEWTDRTESDRLLSYAQLYAQQPVVAAAINKLSRQISTLPLKVYKRVGDNRRERATGHPLDVLLRRPFERRGAIFAKWNLVFPALLHGNALMAKVRRGPDEPPYAAFPLDWSYVSAYAAQGQPVEWWSTTQFGEERFVAAQDTIHVAWQGPAGEIGISPLQQLGVTVALEDAARRQQKAWFRNGIRPSIVVSPGLGPTGAAPSKEMLGFTKAQLEASHKGPDNNAKALLVGPNTDVKAISFTSSEAELVQTRLLNREEVCIVYELPPPLLGDLRHATLANVREFGRQLYTDILRPWLTMIEETLQAQLIDSEPAWAGQDLYVEFDLSEQLKGEPKELAETIKVQIESGLMTPNEGRALLNLPPDGDPDAPDNPANKLYLPVNNLQPIGTDTGTAPTSVAGFGQPQLPEETPEPPSPSQAS